MGAAMTARRTVVIMMGAMMMAGCAPRSESSKPRPEPIACRDSLYLRLARQHPDSLSERAWQRLQGLDSACALARHRAPLESHGTGMMGMGSGRGGMWTVLAPLLVGAMAAAMIVVGL